MVNLSKQNFYMNMDDRTRANLEQLAQRFGLGLGATVRLLINSTANSEPVSLIPAPAPTGQQAQQE